MANFNLVILLTSLFIAAQTGQASATVQIQVNFIYYKNPNGFDANGNSCDPAGGACDPLFAITLKTPDGGELKVTTDRKSDSNSIAFGDKIVNIDNPVVYSRPSYQGQFTLIVRVDDYDPFGSWDYIGTFTYTYVGPAGANNDFRTIYPVTLRDDTKSGSILSVQIAVACLTNFYSADCTKLCVAANDDTAGHYNCDSSGNFVCLPTYDPDSSCRRTFCDSKTPCKNDGRCVNQDASFACNCVGLWGGPTCEAKLSACESATTPCRNGGTCVSGTGASGCVCTAGFNGTYCELDIDECALSVCRHSTACRNQFGTYSCQCSEGWTGSNCSQDVNECAAVTAACFNGATCNNTPPGNFTCQCQTGFRGRLCELDVDECAQSVPPCRPVYEVCRNLQGSYICLCAPGWTGENCTAPYVTDEQVAAQEKNRLLIGLLVPALLLALAVIAAYFGYRLFVRRRALKGNGLELPPVRAHSSANSTENASYVYTVGGFRHSAEESPYEDAEAHYAKVQSLVRTAGEDYAYVAEREPPPDFAAPPLPPKRTVEQSPTAPAAPVSAISNDIGEYTDRYEGMQNAPEYRNTDL